MLLLSALTLGFLHGLGADHLMGIATLSLAPAPGGATAQRTRALGVAIRFAVGHAVLLGAGAVALIVLGWSLPLAVERGGEMLGGALLIVLGAIALWGASGAVYAHSHRHLGEPAAHWHLHVGRPSHHPAAAAHSHLPTIIGAAFAVSSLRALTMLAPFGDRVAGASLPLLLTLVLVFAVGILMSMSLFGVAFARVLSTRTIMRIGRASAVFMALASVSLGVFWIYSASF